MPKKKKAEEEEVYHVEVITKARVSEDHEWEYLVKWAGYGSDADSWEPAENVKQCDRLLASFWKHVGTDDNDYSTGYEIAADETWINKEKRYFQETFVKPPKRKSDKATKQDRQERRKSKSSTPHIIENTADESESPDEEPQVKSPSAKRLHRKARVVETESESESDSRSHNKEVSITSRSKATTAPSNEIPKIPDQIKRREAPLAAGGSTSVVPPKTVIRTHQDQKTHPLVKPMDLPTASVEAVSSLSTKQRIAAGIPPPRTGPKPLSIVHRKSLPALSFKKNKPATALSGQSRDTNTSIATPTSPVAQTSKVASDVRVAASPESMDVDQPVDLLDSILDDPGPPGESSDNPTALMPLKSREEIDAEKFLQTITITELNAPLESGAIPDEPAQLTTELPKIPAISKIPKKWKWTGDLFISTSECKTELLCCATIADPSGTSNTSHINLMLSTLDSLRVSRLYSVMDLSPILQACGKPQYFGTLESNELSEEVIIHGLEHHLQNEGLVAIIPLLLDDTAAAILVIFPATQQKLTEVLQVPEHLSKGTNLLVVLLPFLVPAITIINIAGQRSIEAVMQSSLNLQEVPHVPSQGATLYQAISLLCFPKSLLDFLNSTSPRSYCIWPPSDQVLPGLDTIMLQYILKSTKATPAKLEEDVRVIFICNQHLETLHTTPSLVTKLANSPEVQFWTYGYASNMTSQRWKVQEIYPLGGVITFTPSALVEDLMGCCHLVSQIIEHPLWDCYFIPEVLAMSHLLYNDGDPGTSKESCLDLILDSINLGLISVIKMPGKGHSNQMTWLSQVFNHSNASGSELLEAYIEVLRSHPATSGMTTEQLVTFTNSEIIKDISSSQIQPAFMEKYRRFVVIKAESEGTMPIEKDCLEWSTLSMFSFKDDYFQSTH